MWSSGAGNHNNGANGLSVGAVAGAGKDVGEPKFETRLLLRPKVVLESVLEVLDRCFRCYMLFNLKISASQYPN
jgi:hypothetical protein